MTYKLETKGEEFDAEIQYTLGNVMLEAHHYIMAFLLHIHEMHIVVPLREFSLIADQGGTENFEYHIVSADGREWTQTIKISSTNPEMNFDVPDFWRLSEFTLQRSIRDDIILLVLQHGVKKIEMNFN